jgi:hypothetical protein
MATKRATEPKPTEPVPAAAAADDDLDDWSPETRRKKDEAYARAVIADPIGKLRENAETRVRRAREQVDSLNADLRVARLELKAEEATLLALGPVPVLDEPTAPATKKKTPAASPKSGRATGQKPRK